MKSSGPGLFFVGRFGITKSVFLLGIGLPDFLLLFESVLVIISFWECPFHIFLFLFELVSILFIPQNFILKQESAKFFCKGPGGRLCGPCGLCQYC